MLCHGDSTDRRVRRRTTRHLLIFIGLLSAWSFGAVQSQAGDSGESATLLRPQLQGDWWAVANNPDLGELGTAGQQPVDFGVWQAADGTWQLWSCIRHTREPGKTRLFYGWEGKNITDKDWTPEGITMRANPARRRDSGRDASAARDSRGPHRQLPDVLWRLEQHLFGPQSKRQWEGVHSRRAKQPIQRHRHVLRGGWGQYPRRDGDLCRR